MNNIPEKRIQCTIIDYGMGNLGSIQNMLSRLYIHSVVSADPTVISKASFLILPGVGAFDSAVQRLKDLNLIDVLNDKVKKEKTPVLGICLGMQLMLERSEEGSLAGLGWIPGQVKKIVPRQDLELRVPHMGWNRVHRTGVSSRFNIAQGMDRERYYFVHSYGVHCAAEDHVLGKTHYGESFDSIISRENIIGVQFHPEKSHSYGLNLLKSIFLGIRPC